MRAILARVLLALAVVLFQHGAVAHVLMHAGEETQHRHDGDVKAQHGCDACHLYAGADGAQPPAVLPPLGTAAAAGYTPRFGSPPLRAQPPKPFDSQAPPVLP